MIKFDLAIPVCIVNTIVYDPKLGQFRIDIYPSAKSNSLNYAMSACALLTPNQLNLLLKDLVGYHAIKDNNSFLNLNNISFDVFPGQLRLKSFSCHVAIESIMTEFLTVVGKIRQRIIDLTDQKILTIIQAGDGWVLGLIPLTIPTFHSLVNHSFLRKS